MEMDVYREVRRDARKNFKATHGIRCMIGGKLGWFSGTTSRRFALSWLDKQATWSASPQQLGKDRLPWLLFIKCCANRTMSNRGCSHLDAIKSIKQPQRREREECVKIGAYWVHLRTCQTCGVTLCCDISPNRHVTKHARASGHPVIASAQPGERWLNCY